SAWKIAQPILDAWAAAPPSDFPNYPAGSWGPKAAFDLLERDGRHWVEVINRGVLENVPLFHGSDEVFLHNLAMELGPVVYAAGEVLFHKGETGSAMYVISRGEVDVLNANGQLLNTLTTGDFFGELALLHSKPRAATIRARTNCDLFVLDREDFNKALAS